MSSLAQQVRRRKAQLAESVDVTADERMRILANAWIVRALSLVAAVLAFPLAFYFAGRLMMWIDGSDLAAIFCALIGAVSAGTLPIATRAVGFTLERRYLERVLSRAQERERRRLVCASGASPVAVPSSAP